MHVPTPTLTSKSSEPGLYTKAFVERAVERYKADGRDATIAYYNTAESVDGDWYVFIIDDDGAVIAHPTRPERLGTTFREMEDVTGYNYGAGFAATTEKGSWVEYTYLNPANATYEKKHTWVVKHDGLIFGSGWYNRTTASLLPSKSDEPDRYAKALVEQSLRRYEAMVASRPVAYYNTLESVDGDWYVFIFDGADLLVSNGANPDLLGEDLKGSFGTDVNGYNYGAEMLSATSAGLWVDYMFISPATGQQNRKHSWVVRHDGLLFGPGWYER